MLVTLFFPKDAYSRNKAKIAKVRKAAGCAVKGCWTGSSWVGENLVIEADFQKAALRIGIPREYDGDVLVLSGDENLCDQFIDNAEAWGASIEVTESKNDVEKIKVDDMASLRWFERIASVHGFDKKFISGWKELMQNDIDCGNTPVTSMR